MMRGGELFRFSRSGSFLCVARFISGAFGDKFILELRDKTLNRPGAGFTEGADRAAARNVVRDADQIIGVLLAAVTVGQAMQGLVHPQSAFAAGRALAAAFVRVKF